MKVEGSVAVVTGAAGGIGLAVAQRLLEHGAHVVVTDLDAARTSAAVASLEPHGADRVAGLAGDCSLEADVQAVLDLAVERFGPVDLYVANAGVGLGQGLESSEEDWSTSLDVNVMAHVRAARLLVPVTKHAAVAFAEWLSVTYGTRGIAVSCLCPMGVNTAMLNGGADSDDPTARQGARAVTEAGGVLEPLDVADVVLDAIDDERFLVLPHPEVLEFYRRKASDYDRWLAGMRRYQDTLA